MSYKFGSKTKAAGDETKEEEGPKKTDVAGLTKALEKTGVTFNEFATTTEERRKSILGKDYEETKLKYGWLYDQPIVVEEKDEDKDNK